MRSQDWGRIQEAYLEIALKLQNIGAEAIIICANTPHMVFEFVQPQIQIPILHIADAVGMAAQNQGLNTLGLLGNKPTMTKGFMQKHLLDGYGIETLIPEEKAIEKSHFYVSKELTQGQFSEEAKSFYLEQMEILKEKGAEGIILGCTELPLLINQDDISLPLMATTQLHVDMATQFILNEVA
jgi:aspartate racemase